MKFLNKTIVVTGGTRGIGAAIGDEFSKEGATLILTGQDQSNLKQLERAAKPNVKYVPLELGSKSSVNTFLDLLDGLEHIDVLVNNAGINRIDRVEDIDVDDFETVLNVNLKAPFYICQKVAKLMKRRGGRIINIASIWSRVTKEGRLSYTTSKSALAGLSRALATDMAKYNVLVNTVSPGFVMTELTRQSLSEAEMENLRQIIPLARMAKPSEIAKLVTFLASDDNTYITGQNIFVDGGFSNV